MTNSEVNSTLDTNKVPLSNENAIVITVPQVPLGLYKKNPLAVHCVSVCGEKTVCLQSIAGLKTGGAIDVFRNYKGEDVCYTCSVVVAIIAGQQAAELKEKEAKQLKEKETEIAAQKLAEEKAKKEMGEPIEEGQPPRERKRGRPPKRKVIEESQTEPEKAQDPDPILEIE